MFKPATLAYVPPPEFGCTRTFLDNLKQFKTVYPLILYSEVDYPGFVKLGASPEVAKDRNTWAVNNLAFFTGCRIALGHGVTHMLYLETDCRVIGDGWDKAVFDEYTDLKRPFPIAGTVVCYNPSNGGMEALKRWEKLIVSTNSRRNFPIATYGYRGAAMAGGTSVFVNGAAGIYSMDWISRLFRLTKAADTVSLARSCFAWDFEIGARLWSVLGADAFDAVGYLTTVFSSFGDILTTEAERLAMLKDGRTRIVHQVKSKTGV